MNQAFEKMLPLCCGRRMQITGETKKFLEMTCSWCEDIVIIKKLYFYNGGNFPDRLIKSEV